MRDDFFRTSERADILEMIATVAAAVLLFVLGWQFGRASVKEHGADQTHVRQQEQQPRM